MPSCMGEAGGGHGTETLLPVPIIVPGATKLAVDACMAILHKDVLTPVLNAVALSKKEKHRQKELRHTLCQQRWAMGSYH